MNIIWNQTKCCTFASVIKQKANINNKRKAIWHRQSSSPRCTEREMIIYM